ncbi:MFS transporter [Nonomuraea sp. NPDC046570]|uniref:MFS transporter n=1 Tax=Nonomuraea sp. NPDC046570 TaxID=3155255 RepID=UPI0033D71E63
MNRLLRDARFRRILLGDAVSSLGDSMLFLSLAVWTKNLTGSDAAAGLVFLCLNAPGLLAPLLGHVVDRVSRKKLLMGMMAAMAVIVLALLVVRTAQDVWIIYLVAFCYGVLFSTPVFDALLKDLLPARDAAPARSLLVTVQQGLRIVSPAVGVGIYLAFGGWVLAVVDAATFLIAIACLASVKIVESEPEPAAPLRQSLTAGARHLRQLPLLGRLTLMCVIFMAGAGLLESSTFAAIEQGLGFEAAYFSVIMMLQGGGSILGGLLSGRLVTGLGEARASALGYLVCGAGVLLFQVPYWPGYTLGTVLFGAGMPLIFVALGTAQQLYAPARLQGRLGAAIGMLTNGAQTVSNAVGAAIVGFVDFRVTFGIIALAMLTGCVGVLVRPPAVPEIVSSVADSPEPQAAA